MSPLKRLLAAATVLLASLALFPAASAQAITNPPCTDANFVHLYLLDGSAICFANAGTFRWNDSSGYPVVTKITTGNNDGNYLAFDSGALYSAPRNRTFDFGSNPKVLKQYTIY